VIQVGLLFLKLASFGYFFIKSVFIEKSSPFVHAGSSAGLKGVGTLKFFPLVGVNKLGVFVCVVAHQNILSISLVSSFCEIGFTHHTHTSKSQIIISGLAHESFAIFSYWLITDCTTSF